MTRNEKELNGYLGFAERMSGYDGMDYFEGDLSSFDDYSDYDDFDGDDPQSFATGAMSANVSDPYVIQYSNTTPGTLTAVLFGYNNNFNDPTGQFGNPVGITVTNLQGSSYTALIGQTNNKAFQIGKWRFQSVSAAQLSQTLTISHFDANGKQYSTPLNLSIMRDAYQFQNDILDISKTITVDGNTQITFPLLPLTDLVISMFPVSVLSSKAVLNGGTSLNKAVAPRLSGKNVAPVIINTNQKVGGVIKK
jgi:hypothetical protein